MKLEEIETVQLATTSPDHPDLHMHPENQQMPPPQQEPSTQEVRSIMKHPDPYHGNDAESQKQARQSKCATKLNPMLCIFKYFDTVNTKCY